MHHAQCTNISTHENASFAAGDVPFANGNASFAGGDVLFANGNATFAAWGVPFTDGNAAARTFGRAHRRRPYHFSCGSVSQGRRKRLCRRTKTKNDCWNRLRRRTKSKMVAGRGSADGLKQEKVAGRGSADGQKRKTHPEMCISGVGFRLNMLRKWLSWRLDCEILHFFIIFAAEKIKPI